MRFAALGGAQSLAYRCDRSRFLRSIHLASHFTRRINQRYLCKEDLRLKMKFTVLQVFFIQKSDKQMKNYWFLE